MSWQAQLDRIEAKVDRLQAAVDNVVRYAAYLPLLLKVELQELNTMSELSDAVADLGTKVQADTDVDASAVTLLNGLTAIVKQLQDQVAQAADVPAALAAVKAFATTLDANKTTLSAAVTANTPAA